MEEPCWDKGTAEGLRPCPSRGTSKEQQKPKLSVPKEWGLSIMWCKQRADGNRQEGEMQA